MSEEKRKRPSLVRPGGGLSAYQTPLFEIESRVVEVEKRLAKEQPRLWERAWAAMTLRGILKEIGTRQDAQELSDRVWKMRESLLAEDLREMAPLQEKIARGEFGKPELIAELSSRPRFEWDPFVERLLGIAEPPRPEKQREAEMVHYLASPFEVIMEILSQLGPDDVLYDLGAGLGKVTLSTAWLSPARAKGVEMDPAYSNEALARAKALNFQRVEMICADARSVDYSDGTVFFFYDPFRGAILDAVLNKIREQTTGRKIRILSRGLSSNALDTVPWLEKKISSESGLSLYVNAGGG